MSERSSGIIPEYSAVAAPPNFIHAEGTHLADAQGERFAVKGINLGNWLVPEGYMFKFMRKRAPSEIAGVIEALIGREEASRFWTEFRDGYITQADIRFIKAAGFNTVRVPLHWRLFVEPADAGMSIPRPKRTTARTKADLSSDIESPDT